MSGDGMADVHDGVAKTAYYCCGLRALDAASSRPLCGDQLATRCMTPAGWTILDRFRKFRGPNVANVVRHRIIDDFLRQRLAQDPHTTVLILGAGFDTRAFRLRGGTWVEVDDPVLVAVKERCLPCQEAPNALRRVPVAFRQESPEAALAKAGDFEAAIVVVEGVFPYLSDNEVRAMLGAIRRAIRWPTLICDMTTRVFNRRYSGPIRARLGALGATFAVREQALETLIANAGFVQTSSQSIVARAVALRGLPMPRWLLATVFRSLRDGYVIATFDATDATSSDTLDANDAKSK